MEGNKKVNGEITLNNGFEEEFKLNEGDAKVSNYRFFLILYLGQFLATLASGMSFFAISIYIFRRTGLMTSTSIINLAAFLPTVLLALPYGILADRMDKRLLMILGDSLSIPGLIILLYLISKNAGLLEISLALLFSAIFSAAIDPAFKATISEVLSKEEYTRASSLLSLSGLAKFLLAPFIASILLNFFPLHYLIIFDIFTLVITFTLSFIGREGINRNMKLIDKRENYGEEGIDEHGDENLNSFAKVLDLFKISKILNKKLILLVFLAFLICLFLGNLQVLISPLILSFSSDKALGYSQSIAAFGILVSTLLLSIVPIKKGHEKKLILSFILMGLSMVFIAFWENIYLISFFAFIFFMCLPMANTNLDYIFRLNIKKGYEGRAFGLTSLISQFGYVITYGISGPLGDFISKYFSLSVGRGAAVAILISGLLLIITALIALFILKINSRGEDLDEGFN